MHMCLCVGAENVWPTSEEACPVSQGPAWKQQRISCQSVGGLSGSQEKVSIERKKIGMFDFSIIKSATNM